MIAANEEQKASRDAQVCGPYTNRNEVEVLTVGVAAGQGKDGVKFGPAAMLAAGVIELLEDQLPDATIFHDDVIHTYLDGFQPALVEESRNQSRGSSSSTALSCMNHVFEVSYATECLASQVYQRTKSGRTVLTIGGDHSIAIGTVAGSATACRERFGRDLAVIWVDAHADINPPELSASGNIHGMPLSFLSGLSKTAIEEPFGWLEEAKGGKKSLVAFDKLVYVGLRDADPAEQKVLVENGILVFSTADVKRLGPTAVAQKVLEHIGRETPVHLSFDIDVLDPMVAPSTGCPVSDGLSLEEGCQFCSAISSTSQIVSMDMVEINPEENSGPDLIDAARTVDAALAIIESVFRVD